MVGVGQGELPQRAEVGVRWLSRVGDDAGGHAVLAHLRAECVDVGGVEVDSQRATGAFIRDSHPSRPIEVAYH
ncbi:hypothetical protein ABZ922_31485 [Streptomyces shenzhenensis]|uniref:hypothetical protein n=1 Tax=Streptomyces shenzhenensis TaxID=943815 RepID=UPI0033D6372D